MPFVLGDPTQTSPEVHVGDVGTQFILTVYNQDSVLQNLSTATLLKINFYTPSRVTKERTASLYTSGADGKMVYTLIDGDIDESGEWSYQGLITFPAGNWSTNIEKFIVYPNIPVP
jgi:hypothetical protein